MKLHLLLFSLLVASPALAQGASLLAHNRDGLTQVSTDHSGVSVETRITVEKAESQAKIIFYQETDNGFIFQRINWKKKVLIELDNGATLLLTNLAEQGHAIQPGGYITGYYIPDRYQRYTAFWLSPQDISLLKQYKVRGIMYSLDDPYDAQPYRIVIPDSTHELKQELTLLGF
ncbi:MAG: hypothetical protein KatS3mg031_1899 [Chitinophagales bacterium]|nr:MAG: hypothetical protein KatS3mg031_1899 [Chitinophagales bacterium]